MIRAIADYQIDGVLNTLDFGMWVMQDDNFRDGNFNTNYIEENISDFVGKSADMEETMIAAVAAVEFFEESPKRNNKPILQSRWRQRLN